MAPFDTRADAPSRRLLVISQLYPPAPTMGARRWGAMVKYLERMGHEVTVIAGAPWPGGPQSNGVVWTPDLSRQPGLRRLLRRPPWPGSGDAEPQVLRKRSLVQRAVVPDVQVAAWMPAALFASRRILAAQRIDCVITSSPPASAHLVALALGRARPAWVADFRDGWTHEPSHPPFETAAQRRLDRWLESHVVRRANRIMAATAPIAQDIRSRFGVDARHVSNGWDPEHVSLLDGGDDRISGSVTLVHTGRLSGSDGRDPRPLLDGLRSTFARRPELRDRLRVVFAGAIWAHEEELIRRSGLADVIETPGHLPPAAALSLQRQADALILLASADVSPATGKLYEYLAAERPILALAAADNAAARVVRETGTGVVVPPTDREAITRALVAIAERRLPYEPNRDLVEEYSYPRPAIRSAAEIEEAIAVHSRGART